MSHTTIPLAVSLSGRSKKRSTSLAIGVLIGLAQAQAQEANIWYFGNQAGIDFNSGAPVALLNSSMNSVEASGSISDQNGDLLFYTNGGPVVTSSNYNVGRVWNRNHTMMTNGNLAGSGGCNSARQGALIVKDPGNADLYYIFTTDCYEDNLVGGLRYDVVDMTGSGGMGQVLSIGDTVYSGITESMAGIRHANGIDVWVLVHGLNNNEFHAFLVTANGVAAPVTTAIGPNMSSQPGDITANRFSTRVHYGGNNTSSLYDFDPATGILSNYLNLGQNGFGSAFSYSGNYLYTCEFQVQRRVFQYDLLATDIVASEQVIGSGIALQGGLQLAPDGKIYMARGSQGSIGVINNPELAGVAADFQDEGFYLGGRTCANGLPTFVNDLVQPVTTGIDAVTAPTALSCTLLDGDLVIRARSGNSVGRYAIYRNDGSLVREGRSNGANTSVRIAGDGPGLYVVRLTNGSGQEFSSRYVLCE
ncbi:MAG: hypothetical protein H6594_10145 [Flavobacteriales bacterium]|nr:hypothetical protein [Flavobacteriales bacterium]